LTQVRGVRTTPGAIGCQGPSRDEAIAEGGSRLDEPAVTTGTGSGVALRRY
jgi:hypothetical protein